MRVTTSGMGSTRSIVRKRRRAVRSSAGHPDVYKPHDVMVLSVDPGDKCGAALTLRGQYVDSGHGHGYDPRFISKWICTGRDFARLAGVPLILVLEKPPMGGAAYPGRNLSGAASVIGCRKLWLSLWRQCADVKTRLHADVYPVRWRARVVGTGSGPDLESRELAGAARVAHRVFVSRDEAAAVCIGQWAARAGALGQLLHPVKKTGASVDAAGAAG